MAVANNTIANSDATGDGGGIYNDGAATLKNTIVAGNPTGDDCSNVSGNIAADKYNLDSDGSCGNRIRVAAI